MSKVGGTIKIYNIWCYTAMMIAETGSRYSLEPWGNNIPDYKGEDDGGHEYVLPDYIEQGEYVSGTKYLEDIRDRNRVVILGGTDTPVLHITGAHGAWTVSLKQASCVDCVNRGWESMSRVAACNCCEDHEFCKPIK